MIALEDVLRLSGFEHGTQAAIGVDLARDVVEILTLDGPVAAVPDWVAGSILRSAIKLGRLHPTALEIVQQAERIALGVQLAELDPAEWSAWFAAVDAQPLSGERTAR